MPNHPATIYALRDPRDDTMRYIGKARDVARRYGEHCRLSNNLCTRRHVCNWLRGLLNAGFLPQLQVLEQAQDWTEAEPRWIAAMRAAGQPLTNLADGGVGNGHMQRAPKSVASTGAQTTLHRAQIELHSIINYLRRVNYPAERIAALDQKLSILREMASSLRRSEVAYGPN